MSASPFKKIFVTVVALLRQGVTPEKLALSIALGAMIGVFPVLGSTTLLCAAVALLLRLNLPIIQLVNYLIYPVQLILFLPFLQAGSRIAHAAPVKLSMTDVFSMIQSDPGRLIRILWTASLGAMALWLMLSPFVTAAVYFTLAPVFRKLRSRITHSSNLPR